MTAEGSAADGAFHYMPLIRPIECRANAARSPDNPFSVVTGIAATRLDLLDACTCWKTRLARNAMKGACQMPPCPLITSFAAPTTQNGLAWALPGGVSLKGSLPLGPVSSCV